MSWPLTWRLTLLTISPHPHPTAIWSRYFQQKAFLSKTKTSKNCYCFAAYPYLILMLAFRHKWESVSLAVWMKYPNPFSSHVLSADIVSRHLDPETNLLHTVRLIHKTGTLPGWVMNILKSQEAFAFAFVIEESVVDPQKCFMQTRTRNLTHQRFLVTEEVQTYTKSPEEQTWTLADCQATVKCNRKWTAGLGSKIEGMGVKRFADHFPKSKMAMAYILDKLRNREKII